MSTQMAQLQEATIKAQCKVLRMPMIGSQFATLAEQAIREKKSHAGYLEALLAAEIEERERNTIERRIREAHLPLLLGCSCPAAAAAIRQTTNTRNTLTPKATRRTRLGDCGHRVCARRGFISGLGSVSLSWRATLRRRFALPVA